MKQHPARWLIGLVIVGFWLTMMGLLMKRELGVRRMSAGTPARVESAVDTWLGVYLGEEQRVGHIHIHQSPEERQGLPGARTSLDSQLRLNLLGKATDLDLSGFVWRPYDAPQAEFEFKVRSMEHDFRIAGELIEGELRSQVFSAGESLPFKVPVRGDLMFSSGFGATLELPSLEVGEEVLLESFDPMTLRKSVVRVRCLARETLELSEGPIAVRRLSLVMGGIRSLAWVDDVGEVVRAETPFGLILQKISPDDILSTNKDPQIADPGDGLEEFLGQTSIRPTGLKPFRSARTMTLRLDNVEELELPTDGVQVALGEARYRLTVPPLPDSSLSSSEETPTPGSDSSDDGVYLASDAFVQADHPRIVEQAREIVGEEKDRWRRALQIHRWVFTELEKEAVLSIPSALEVLRQRRGDCNEHTVLFTALARAAGVPTRIAIGVVWSDELAGFYYHAWPEIRLGGNWIWMDPTLDQPLADATHLKLLNGGLENWPQLLPYLGRLQIEVLEVE
jgi:hypothetical protein